jgi:hypothetical protein
MPDSFPKEKRSSARFAIKTGRAQRLFQIRGPVPVVALRSVPNGLKLGVVEGVTLLALNRLYRIQCLLLKVRIHAVTTESRDG